MKISYNWLRDLVETALEPRALASRLTFAGLAVDAVHQTDDDFVLEFDLTSNRPDCLSHLGIAREAAALEKKALQIPNTQAKQIEGQTKDLASVEILDAGLCPRYAARVVRGVRVQPSPAWLQRRLTAIGLRPINNVVDITNYVLHELGQPLHAFDLEKLTERKIIVRRARNGEMIKALDGIEYKLDAEMLVIADAARAVAIAGVMGGEETAVTDETRDVLIESAYFQPASVRKTSRALNLTSDSSYRFERGVDPEGIRRAQDRAVALLCELAGGTATADAIDVYPNPIAPATVNFRAERVERLTGLNVEANETVEILFSLGFRLQTKEGVFDGQSESLFEVYAPLIFNPRQTAPLRFIVPTWRYDVEIEEDLVEEVARIVGYDKIASELPKTNTAGEYRAGEMRRRRAQRALTACGFDEAISFSFISAAHDEQFELLPRISQEASDYRLESPKSEVPSPKSSEESGVRGRESGEDQLSAISQQKTGETNPQSAIRHPPSKDLGLGTWDFGLECNSQSFVELENPIIEGAARMRPTLLPGLLDAVRRNFNHGTRDVRLFELGIVFGARGASEKLPREVESLGLAMTGTESGGRAAGTGRELDFYDLKGAIELIGEAMNLPPFDFSAHDARHLRTGQAAQISLNDLKVGTLGRLSDELAAAYKFKQPVFVAELDFGALLAAPEEPARYVPLPRFPSSVRDISVIAPRRVAFGAMRRAVLDLHLPTLRRVELVDVYEGAHLPEDARSVTLRVEYRADERTLRDEEVDAMQARVIAELESRFGAKLRS
jgi:phenylalanyl-tRNA synthetase beta chain